MGKPHSNDLYFVISFQVKEVNRWLRSNQVIGATSTAEEPGEKARIALFIKLMSGENMQKLRSSTIAFRILSIVRELFPEDYWGVQLPIDDAECLRWFLTNLDQDIAAKVPAKARAPAAKPEPGVEWSYDDVAGVGK